jgi:hypothetical protein
MDIAENFKGYNNIPSSPTYTSQPEIENRRINVFIG